MTGSLHLDELHKNKYFFFVFNDYLIRFSQVCLFYVCIFLLVYILFFFSFVQPYSCGPQSCRHSVCEDRIIHRHEWGGPSVHFSKLLYSILFDNIGAYKNLNYTQQIKVNMGADLGNVCNCTICILHIKKNANVNTDVPIL